MILRITGEQILAMLWLEHNAFSKEFKHFCKKQKPALAGFNAIKKLLAKQFDPINPDDIIAPGKIHRVYQSQTWEIWKVEAIVQGLKPNQWPRIWFAVNGDEITFLTIGSHTENYDNNAKDRIAIERVTDLL
ncbi:MAG: hypothetical protein PWQ10_158 [Patescibacteria group bacterium]|nr:hypothetical protein [Patescibacteria group bacterium]